MNIDTLNEVHSGDLPQRVRNTIVNQVGTRARDVAHLKVEINNFCWMHLPGNTTLRKCEIIACKIFTLMSEEEGGESNEHRNICR